MPLLLSRSRFHPLLRTNTKHFYLQATSATVYLVKLFSSVPVVASHRQTSFCFLTPSNSSPPVYSSLYKHSRITHNMYFTSVSQAGDFTILQFPCLSDNYGYLLHDPETKETAAIDTPDANVYEKELTHRGWSLTHIWNTHHHYDHTGGNCQLKAGTPMLQIYGPFHEQARIPNLDIAVRPGDRFSFGRSKVTVLDVGGHTEGHVAFHLEKEEVVFVGDALFSLGCGRMFEGTSEQFWGSVKRLRALKDETMVYCGHEYTYENGKFAISIEPSNTELQKRFEEVQDQVSKKKPTVPTSISQEKQTNPFLRVDVSDELRRNVGAKEKEEDFVVFGKLRWAKDMFCG